MFPTATSEFFLLSVAVVMLSTYLDIYINGVSSSVLMFARLFVVLSLSLFAVSYLIPVVSGGDPWIDPRTIWILIAAGGCLAYWSSVESQSDALNYKYQHPQVAKVHSKVQTLYTPDNRLWTGLLLLVFFLGSFLRFYNLGYLSLTSDEIYLGMSIKAIGEHWLPIYPDGTLYDRGLVHVYLGWIVTQIIGHGETAVRFPSALASSLTIPLLYFIARDFSGDKRIGIVAAATWALFPWGIEFARWGRDYALVSFLFIATFYTTYLGFSNRRIDYLGFAVGFCILSVVNSIIGFISIGVIGLGFVIWGLKRETILKRRNIIAIAIVLLIIPIYRVLFHLVTGGPLAGIVDHIIYAYVFLLQFKFDPYFPAAYHSHFTIGSILFVISSLSLLCFDSKNVRENAFLLFFSYVPLVFMSYYNIHHQPRYLYFFTPLFITMCLVGVAVFIRDLLNWIDISEGTRRQTTLIFVVIIALFAFTNVGYATEIPTRNHGATYQEPFYSPTTGLSTYGDSKSQMIYVANHADRNDSVVTTGFQYYYYYTGEQPDYWLRPGGHASFIQETPNGTRVRYMTKTGAITSPEKLVSVANHTKGEVWIAYWQGETNTGPRDELTYPAHMMDRGCDIERVYVGDEELATVWRLNSC
ncbi:ArnT family glycosyltransferase [Halosimplex halophilum]|uniref:ArnT family glycosyltransferase n=1 Tax=Halosimplex halophilum TaxID=2559572 RepID=UPI0014354A67|nr:glycosyltransferase family 39 protein [Halosimplex halophilum]